MTLFRIQYNILYPTVQILQLNELLDDPVYHPNAVADPGEGIWGRIPTTPPLPPPPPPSGKNVFSLLRFYFTPHPNSQTKQVIKITRHGSVFRLQLGVTHFRYILSALTGFYLLLSFFFLNVIVIFNL